MNEKTKKFISWIIRNNDQIVLFLLFVLSMILAYSVYTQKYAIFELCTNYCDKVYDGAPALVSMSGSCSCAATTPLFTPLNITWANATPS